MDDGRLAVEGIVDDRGVSEVAFDSWANARGVLGWRVGYGWQLKRDEVGEWVHSGRAVDRQDIDPVGERAR